MSFIQRELDKISKALHACPKADVDKAQYMQLYLAQQALSWALDPTMYRSPFNFITNADTTERSSLTIVDHVSQKTNKKK